MSHVPAARLKVAFPQWSIHRVPPSTGTGFTACRGLPGGGSQSLHPPTLAELTRATAELGPVDVLVNNAGFGLWKPLEETSIAEWDHTFAVNVRAAACLCTAVLPGMQARRFGRVINIGSEAGVAIVPGLAAYCISKHALRALTEVIQDANHDNGIKAWIICPGFVDTDMGEVVPGTNPLNFLRVGEVVDMARYLIRLDYNVKLGPEILIRTMRNPMTT